MKPDKLFFICGPHCAGKTSIIRRLKEDGVAGYTGHEIGKELFYEQQKNGFRPDDHRNDFEELVHSAEINRDKLIHNRKGIKVIETWHPGNLAYVLVRSSHLYESFISRVKSESPVFNVNLTGIRLSLDPELISKRTRTFSENPAWAVDFYRKIENILDKPIHDLNLDKRTHIVDASGNFDAVYNQVCEIIRGT